MTAHSPPPYPQSSRRLTRAGRVAMLWVLYAALWAQPTDMRAQTWRQVLGLPVTPPLGTITAGAILRTAGRYLNRPYDWGGVNEGGFDCSGFTNRIYALHGYDLPRTSREQFKVGEKVPLWDLKPGDLLFFVHRPHTKRITHVALYAGNNRLVHAAQGKGKVTFDSLKNAYYQQRLLGARRILSLPPGRYSTSLGTARSGFIYPPGQAPRTSPALLARLRAPPDNDALRRHALTDKALLQKILREHAPQKF